MIWNNLVLKIFFGEGEGRNQGMAKHYLQERWDANDRENISEKCC